MSREAKRLKCPGCGKQLTRVHYTEHGTKVLVEHVPPQRWRNVWQDAWQEAGEFGDCTFFCPECDCEFEVEELGEAGII